VFRIKKYSYVLFCMIISILMISSFYVSAHEIFYNGSTPAPLKWYDVSYRTANLKMNGDYLSIDYSPQYYSVRVAWPNASSRVSVTNSSFYGSNVDLATASENTWDNRFGIPYGYYVYGVCDMVSTDGYQLNSYSNANVSSKLIKYAGILLTPYTDEFDNSTQMRFVMVHEIGHALGLGHPNTYYFVTNDASVMRQGTTETYYAPQTHDINDLNNKY